MKNLLLVLVSILLFSCSASSDVVDSGFFQKRKYNKGYHLSFKKKEKNNPQKLEKDLSVIKEGKILKKEKVKEDTIFKVLLIESEKEAKFYLDEFTVASDESVIQVQESSIIKKEFKKYKASLDEVIDKREEGINKVLISRIKTFTIATMASLLGYIAASVLVLLNANIILSFIGVGLLIVLLISFFLAIRSLIKYVNYNLMNKEELTPREKRELGYAKRLNTFSKLLLLLLALVLVSFFLLIFVPMAVQASLLFALLFFVVVLHYIVFLVFTIVSFIILLILSSKHMKKDSNNKKINSDDYYYE